MSTSLILLCLIDVGVVPPGKKAVNKKKSKAKKGGGENVDGSDDDGGDSVGTSVTIALQSNTGKLQEIPAPVPKSKKGNKGQFLCLFLCDYVAVYMFVDVFFRMSMFVCYHINVL